MLPLTLLVATYVSGLQSITLDEFKARPIPTFAKDLTGEDLVDYLNVAQPFFQAKLSTLSEEEKKALIMEARFLRQIRGGIRASELDVNGSTIPDSFDAREKWPTCESIKNIRDQSACGSCWAVSAASTMSDRLCIGSGGRINVKLMSDTDILSCCGLACGNGCRGGYVHEAWEYVLAYGACSGGAYGQRGVCKQYPFHPCGYHKGKHYYGKCPKKGFSTPICQESCQPGYLSDYESDKTYVTKWYYVLSSVEAIQKEIMTNGPVQATFTVYDDFYNYNGGIYVHTGGKLRGGHAIKIIGWGVDNGTPYWLISNSWSSDWGESGLFRIARGKNECDIEAEILAGLIKV